MIEKNNKKQIEMEELTETEEEKMIMESVLKENNYDVFSSFSLII